MRPVNEIVAALEHRIAQGGYVGLVAGLWCRGWSEVVGRGLADRGTGAPVDAASAFEIGSVGKALTGVLLALMHETGDVSLNEPIGRFLAGRMKTLPALSEGVTLLDLATHHSGLPAMSPHIEDMDLDGPHPSYPFEALCSFLSSFVPPSKRTYRYSNLGYGLLGFCLSVRANQPFDALLAERVLHPLGMMATNFVLAESGGVTGHAADGHARPAWQVPEVLRGAGGLQATAGDLLRFAVACLDPPAGPLGRAIASALRPRRHAHGSYDIGLGWETNYGFPPDVVAVKGGLTAGFSANCLIVPARQEAVILLANSMQCISDLSYYLLDGRFGLHPEARWEPAFIAPPLWQGEHPMGAK